MRRREFITILGGAAAMWPLAARSEPRLPVIGFVRLTTLQDSATFLSAFRRGLAETSYIEGQNFTIETRFASNQVDRLPNLMAELVSMDVAVLVATGGTISARAAKAATSTKRIPSLPANAVKFQFLPPVIGCQPAGIHASRSRQVG